MGESGGRVVSGVNREGTLTAFGAASLAERLPAWLGPFCAREGSAVVVRDAQGEVHDEEAPAVVRDDGTMEWYVRGRRHREDGPAVEEAYGARVWCLEGSVLARHEAEEGRALACMDVAVREAAERGDVAGDWRRLDDAERMAVIAAPWITRRFADLYHERADVGEFGLHERCPLPPPPQEWLDAAARLRRVGNAWG